MPATVVVAAVLFLVSAGWGLLALARWIRGRLDASDDGTDLSAAERRERFLCRWERRKARRPRID